MSEIIVNQYFEPILGSLCSPLCSYLWRPVNEAVYVWVETRHNSDASSMAACVARKLVISDWQLWEEQSLHNIIHQPSPLMVDLLETPWEQRMHDKVGKRDSSGMQQIQLKYAKINCDPLSPSGGNKEDHFNNSRLFTRDSLARRPGWVFGRSSMSMSPWNQRGYGSILSSGYFRNAWLKPLAVSKGLERLMLTSNCELSSNYFCAKNEWGLSKN